MESAGAARADGNGHFEFKVDPEPQTPYLVQASVGGVNYNKMIPPGSPSSNVEIEVFDSSKKVPEANVSEHAIFLQPQDGGLLVQEIIAFENKSNIAYNDPTGTLHFYLPPEAKGQVSVSVQGLQGMALQREAMKTPQANIYAVDQAIKPGTTRFNVQYMLPQTDTFVTKAVYKEPIDIVAPAGVTVAGDNLRPLGTHPQTQATLFRSTAPELSLKVSGTPREMPAADAADTTTADDTGGIDIKKPLIYERLILVVTFAFAMLLIGFVLLYRKQAPADKRQA